jgi:lipopolysaccharide transport system permease protein
MLVETIIAADRKSSFKQYFKDIWNYRDLLGIFIMRDIKVRYKQTVLGVLWVLIQPLLTAGIFSVIFGTLAKIPSQGLPYPLFYLAALIPWTCFTNAISQASGSLESSAGLIKKVYFPRILIPSAMVLGTIIDFLIGWTAFTIVAIVYGYWTWFFIPFTFVMLLLQQSAAMGIGLILGIFNAQYRDVRYVIPFLLNTLMLTSPIIFPIELIRGSHMLGSWAEVAVSINPMAGVVETYRALLAGTYIPYKLLECNFCVAGFLLLFGIWIFRKREDQIMDLL